MGMAAITDPLRNHGASMTVTDALWSAKIVLQKGPGNSRLKSSTCMPSRALGASGEATEGRCSFILRIDTL